MVNNNVRFQHIMHWWIKIEYSREYSNKIFLIYILDILNIYISEKYVWFTINLNCSDKN